MKQLGFLFLFWIVLISLPSFGQDQASGTCQNPVIPGDFPDPTVIRVGESRF